jgi:hypothetical protein
MAPVYFVNYYLHNKDNDGWAYKVVGKYNNPDVAEKAYYGELENYVGGDEYDSVVVSLTDSLDNKLLSRYWTPHEQPAPETQAEG